MAQIDKVLYLDADLTVENLVIDCDIENGAGGRLPNYTGDYTIVPNVVSQTIDTINKSMISDIVVKEIPTDEVSNEYGITFAIAR